MKKNTIGFTLVEIVVTITILVILSTIGFVQYASYINDARDSQRKSDLSQLKAALNTYKDKKGFYPLPGNKVDVALNGEVAIYSGDFSNKVRMGNSLDSIPTDPKIHIPYKYAITKNKQEFEIAATLEEGNYFNAIVSGDYKSVSIDIVPSLLTTDNNLSNQHFILNNQNHNIPYTFEAPFSPKTDNITWANLKTELQNEIWQSSDYRSCEELTDAGKLLISTSITYQILNNDGSLVNQTCP